MEIKAVWEPTVPKPYGYIYVTHDLAENKFYCGKHKSEKFDVNYFGSGVLLKKSMSTHEPKDFVCVPIDWADSAEELHEKEVNWIQYYNAVNDPQWYNLIEDSNEYYADKHLVDLKIYKPLSKLVVNNYREMSRLEFTLIHYLAAHIEPRTNYFYGSRKKIVEDLDTASSHISDALKVLYKLDICCKTKTKSGISVIMLNPRFISGNITKPKLLRLQKIYNELGRKQKGANSKKSAPNVANNVNSYNNIKESIKRSIKFGTDSKQIRLFDYLSNLFKDNKVISKTVNEIAGSCECNRKLVLKFLRLLESEGIIKRQRGRIELKVSYQEFSDISLGL